MCRFICSLLLSWLSLSSLLACPFNGRLYYGDTNQPAPHQVIVFYSQDGTIEQALTTDGRGYYHGDFPMGTYRVRTFVAGYKFDTGGYTVAVTCHNPNGNDFTMGKKLAGVTGQVRNSTVSPTETASGAILTFTEENGYFTATATTQPPLGMYTVPLPPGRYRLLAKYKGSVIYHTHPGSVAVVVTGSGYQTFNISYGH